MTATMPLKPAPRRCCFGPSASHCKTGKCWQATGIRSTKASDNDLYVISEVTDRLDLLAHKYYGDRTLWWIIAVANNINDASFYVKEGIQLRIPSDISKILNDLEKINK